MPPDAPPLSGRLGLDGIDLRHEDRAGFVEISRGRLEVEDGCLVFVAEKVRRSLPYQQISCILLGPGSGVTHDALRLCARHGVGICAVGDDVTKCYTSAPLLHRESELGRRQARAWADPETRLAVARRQFAIRFGESPPARDLDELRGLEGARIRQAYKRHAKANGISFKQRRDPHGGTDPANIALNYAAHSAYAAAATAVYVVGAIPQLGFLHEAAGNAFVLDVADLYRTELIIPIAFAALRDWSGEDSLERRVRRAMGREIRGRNLVSGMIEQIDEVLT